MSYDSYFVLSLVRTFLQGRGPSFLFTNGFCPPLKLPDDRIIAITLCVRELCHILKQ